jgi:alginate O-acetyltransferase complex protein AlgI
MLFNSLNFIYFFFTFLLFIIIIPKKFWKYTIIIFSSFFYAYWDFKFLALLYFIIFTTYISSKIINTKKSKKILFLQIGLIIFNLCLFKYFNFFSLELEKNFNLNYSQNFKNLLEKVILPIGISFYSFQCISYLVDIYRGGKLPRFIDFFVFVIFFPQIIAGPILRSKYFIPQIELGLSINLKNLKKSILLILWGYFLKLCLADNAGIYIDKNIENLDYSNGISTTASIFFYNFQIYGDFCGYSLIAIGISKLFGLNIPANFNNPYFAKSFKNFWERWHISLSTFIRDYIYIPLGGNKLGKNRTSMNTIIAMSLAGAWHGASVFFLIWGLLHALFLIIERFVKKKINPKFYRIIVILLITIAWIPFRVNSSDDMSLMVENILNINTYKIEFLINKLQFIKIVLLITFLLIIELFLTKKKLISLLKNEKIYSLSIILLLIIILIFGNFNENTFIYFQF